MKLVENKNIHLKIKKNEKKLKIISFLEGFADFMGNVK